MAASYEPSPDTYHFFYAAPDRGQVIQYSRKGTTAKWNQFGTSSTWKKADANSGLFSMAWENQVWLYYITDGVLYQSHCLGGTWKETFTI